MNKKYLLKDRFHKTKSRHWESLYLCECSALLIRRSNSKSKITCSKCKEIKVNFDIWKPIKSIYNKYVSSAWVREFSFNLDLNSFAILILSNCTYCKAGLSNKFRHRKGVLEYNGIDRRNNGQGYQISNCVSCCRQCNTAKNVLKLNDFFAWIEDVYKNAKKKTTY